MRYFARILNVGHCLEPYPQLCQLVVKIYTVLFSLGALFTPKLFRGDPLTFTEQIFEFPVHFLPFVCAYLRKHKSLYRVIDGTLTTPFVQLIWNLEQA